MEIKIKKIKTVEKLESMIILVHSLLTQKQLRVTFSILPTYFFDQRSIDANKCMQNLQTFLCLRISQETPVIELAGMLQDMPYISVLNVRQFSKMHPNFDAANERSTDNCHLSIWVDIPKVKFITEEGKLYVTQPHSLDFSERKKNCILLQVKSLNQ